MQSNMLRCSRLLAALFASFLLTDIATAVTFELVNNCEDAVWPAIVGSSGERLGYRLDALHPRVTVNISSRDAQIFARTHCDEEFECLTGSCGSELECDSGAEPSSPVTVAHFHLMVAGEAERDMDFYHVSAERGFNVAITVTPIQYTVTDEREYTEILLDCRAAGKCVGDLKAACPVELRVVSREEVVGCKPACEPFDKDFTRCEASKNPQEFKKACPGMVSYIYDSDAQFRICRGKNNASPEYRIDFC